MKINTSEKVPVEILEKIKDALNVEEFENFKKSLDEERVFGLRVNTLKISVENFLKISPFELTPVPWVENGFYYHKEERPGKHPYYYAGLYYLQEPSAMLPAKMLSPKEHSTVLDLCAAPGGKSTQLGEMMKNTGCLFVNDISPKRTMVLISHIVRMGITNAVISNSKPETMEKELRNFFSHILIDAPCSGEGMFRRDSKAIDKLTLYSVGECQITQREIINSAFKMLEPEGLLTFSTCTFNKIENEENLDWMKDNFSVEVKEIKRIWPHKEKGEGQFASLIKKVSSEGEKPLYLKNKIFKDESFESFLNDTIADRYKNVFDFSRIIEVKGKVYLLPKKYPSIKKINRLRPGWFLGEIKKNRFEPSPDLPLALPLEAFKRFVNFSVEDREVVSYLKGETIVKEFPDKGWSVLAVEGFPLGWFKKDGGFLKNYYPKNMRRMD